MGRGSWHCHVSQARGQSVTPSPLLVGGRGEAKKLQSCSIQMHVRALGGFLHALSESPPPESPAFESGLDREVVLLFKKDMG